MAVFLVHMGGIVTCPFDENACLGYTMPVECRTFDDAETSLVTKPEV